MMRLLIDAVPGQHIGLQTDDAQALYESVGFRPQPEFWSLVSGTVARQRREPALSSDVRRAKLTA